MATTCCFFLKDPTDTLDYSMDWNVFLPTTDAITASDWSQPSGITVESHRFTARTTHIWISGGTVGETYIFSNRITTSEGRIVERSMALLIAER